MRTLPKWGAWGARGRSTWVGLGGLVGALLIPKCPMCLVALLGLAGSLGADDFLANLFQWPLPHALVMAGLSFVVLLTWRVHGWTRGLPAALLALGTWGAKFFLLSSVFSSLLGCCIALLWLAPPRVRLPCCPLQDTPQSNVQSLRKTSPQ